jgi:hypothetical protein
MKKPALPPWPDRLRDLEAQFDAGVACSVLSSMIEARGGYQSLARVAKLDPHLKALCLAKNAVEDVGNDQFAEYFAEPLGALAGETVAALQRLGSDRVAGLFARAMAVLNPDGPVPADKKERKALLKYEDCIEGLAALDKEFERLPIADKPDLLGYALAHAAQLSFTDKDFANALAECEDIIPVLNRAKTGRRAPKPKPAPKFTGKAQRGGCQCGAIRYEVKAALKPQVCHCVECRKQSASAFGIEVEVHRDALRLVQGAPGQWTQAGHWGPTTVCTFCPDCGTRLWEQTRRDSVTVSLRGGSLDTPLDLTRAAHACTEHKLPGVEVPRGAEQ